MTPTYMDDSETRTDERGAPCGAPIDTATKVKDAVADLASKTKDKADEAGRTVQNKIDQKRAPAADKLGAAPQTLHRKAESLPGGESVKGLAHHAAETMQDTAEYVRSHDVRDMVCCWYDCERNSLWSNSSCRRAFVSCPYLGTRSLPRPSGTRPTTSS